jgi:ribosome assembly protein YihI (activator of Der GTPase)
MIMKAQLENILAELDAIDKIQIDSMGVMMDVLQKMEGLMGSLGAMYEEFQSMPQEQAAEVAALFEQVQVKMESLQVKIDKIEFN